MKLQFFVPGIPAPGGSKRFVGFGKKTGRAILIDDAGQRNKDWRNAVAWIGCKEMAGQELFRGPLAVDMRFYMPRPKGHYDARGLLRTTAPSYPTTKPDVLKLARSTEDALTGIVWNDDAQTAQLTLAKFYATRGGNPGAIITIHPL